MALIRANGDPTDKSNVFEIDLLDIASDMGISLVTVQTKLNLMDKAGVIAYKRPYRGSITIVHRERLALDIDELDIKRKREVEKFNAMLEFLDLPSNEAKHKYLSDYFGWEASKAGGGKDYPLPDRVVGKVNGRKKDLHIDIIEVSSSLKQEIELLLGRPLVADDAIWQPKRLLKLKRVLGEIDRLTVVDGGF